jgi:hypothetical protein
MAVYLLKKMIMKLVLHHIKTTGDDDIQRIIHTIIDRFRQTHPETEIMFISLPRYDLDARQQQLELFVTFLRNHDPAMHTGKSGYSERA